MGNKNKDIKIQFRVSEHERAMIDLLYQEDNNFNLSSFFREKIKEVCIEKGIWKEEIGVGRSLKVA